MENESFDKKIVSISEKRQLTIPQKFYKKLGFTNVAECIMNGSEIIIKPADYNSSNDDFSEYIIADLIKEGYSGEDLLKEYKKRKNKVRPAVLKMIEEADNIAEGKGEFYTSEDIFGEE